MRPLRSMMLCVMLTVGAASAANASPPACTAQTPHVAAKRSRLHRLIHKASWAGVGTAAHHFAGTIGTAAVGVAKYHEDLALNWHTRRRAAIDIGVPIAIGATLGIVGSAAYEAFEHRQWIARHWPFTKHRSRECP